MVLSAFTLSRKTPNSFVMSFRPNVSARFPGWISVIFGIWNFHKTLSKNWTKISGTLHGDLSTSYCYRQHEFAITQFCATLNIFVLLILTCS